MQFSLSAVNHAKAFTAHLLRFALAKELTPADTLTIDAIVAKSGPEKFKLKSVIREVILSDRFLGQNLDWCLDQD
jgi:hypothetical protein